nr:GNAT family N-acetyltransferase [uncultured Allomuricauda sp.]
MEHQKTVMNNPFLKKNFKSTWIKYFSSPDSETSIKAIEELDFIKSKYFHYHNVGRNMTNGMTYKVEGSNNGLSRKVFLIYDVLPGTSYIQNGTKTGVRKSRQIKGYLTDFEGFSSYEDYYKSQFSSKRRGHMRRTHKKLYDNFDITFKALIGKENIDLFDCLYDSFIKMIKERFSELGIHHNILNYQDYYRELMYKMIESEQGVMHCLLKGDSPIAICFSFLSEDRVFFATQTFDVSFKKYSLGDLLLANLLEWSFKNGFKIFDYSKGDYYYKRRWSNFSYYFENHILYNKNVFSSVVLSYLLLWYFDFKQFLREKEINKFVSKLKFLIRGNKNETKESVELVKVENQDSSLPDNLFSTDNRKDEMMEENEFKTAIYDYLFYNPQPEEELKYYYDDSTESYYIKSKSEILLAAKK